MALAALSPRFIPYCMDEFAHYHALGCATHPLTAKWSANADPRQFREPCGAYDLRLPFTRTPLPLRAYHYIGSFPALPFLPFWLLGDPVAARLQGAFFLLAASALLARLTGARFLDLLLAACVFPAYALAFVVDLGPVGLSLTLLGLALLCVRGALGAAPPRRQIGFGAAAGLLFFLGFWTKLVFAWTLPALLLFGLRELRGGKRSWLPGASAAVLCAGVPSLLLLWSTDADGESYLSILREGNISAAATARDLGLHPLLRLVRYVGDGSVVLPRTLLLPHWPLDVLPLLLAIALLALGWKQGGTRVLLGLAGVTLVATILTRSAWGPHHAAFAMFFLVAALGVALGALRLRSRLLPAGVAALLLLYWLTLFARLPAAVINADSSFGKDALLRFMRRQALEKRVVQAHTTWGTFYIELLFGDRDQIVLWAPALPVKPELLAEVKSVARAERRAVVLISLRREEDLLTPAVLAALGPPVAQHAFDDWRLVEFGR